MKKLRPNLLALDDELALPLGLPSRPRIPRKEYLALGNDYARPPKKKLSKAARAQARRWRRSYQQHRPLEPRPPHDAPWWVALKEQVLAVGRCRWCGATRSLTVDHIRPLIHGGTNALRNLQCLCVACNKAKGDQVGLFSWPD